MYYNYKMPFSFSVWFRNLLRPRVTHIDVVVLEKGRVKNLSTYPTIRLSELTSSINELWNTSTRGKQTYWFETEIYEHSSCFKKRPPTMQVTCYTEHLVNPNLKQKADIPIRYRQKFFDKTHTLKPKSTGYYEWPEIQIQFTNTKKT